MDRRIGVYICECGPNIAEKIDIDKVIKAVTPLEDVSIATRYKLLCSEEGKKFLEEHIKKNEITHLVVTACSPRDHQHTFMTICETAGINPLLFQMANIREQCAWITENKDEATNKAIRLTKAAIERVRYHVPLEKKEIESNPDVLVIGGGIAGLETSLHLASPKRKIYLAEKNTHLGGILTHIEKTFPDMQSCPKMMQEKIDQINNNDNIKVYTNCEITEILGFFGNFEVKITEKNDDNTTVGINVGAVVLATGCSLFDPMDDPDYGYGKLDNVITALEFEKMNLAGNIRLKNDKKPTSVAIIHCVGRDKKGYCSEICCMYSLKFVRYLQNKLPETKISNFYSDLCLPEKSYQKFYEQSRGKKNDFIRADSVKITNPGNKLTITYNDEQGSKKSNVFDMVILSPALQPPEDTKKLAEFTRISQDEKGFFAEEHEKLGPVTTSTEGVYIAGCAQGPKSIQNTLIQAEAVSGKILSSLIPGKKIEPEVKVAHISEAFCIGCKTCLTVCSYGVITFDSAKKACVVNQVICQGCGNCAAACPSGAASLKHFTNNQLRQEIKEAVV